MYFTYFLVLIFQLFLIVCSQKSPSISDISQEQFKEIGANAKLVCITQDLGENPIIWMKGEFQSGIHLSTSYNLLVNDSRFSINHNKDNSTFTLEIKDIQETDAGMYTCLIPSTNASSLHASTQLTLIRPPVILDNSSRSMTVSEGQPVDLECYANGYPTPTISWRREKNAVLPTGGVIFKGNILQIKNVRKEDRGTYYCIAENRVGKGTKRIVNLIVEFAPIVTVLRPRVGQALGHDAQLECHIEAYPTPGITWLQNGTQSVHVYRHYDFAVFEVGEERINSTVRVKLVRKAQYGKYVCRVGNKLGIAEGAIELFETTYPEYPEAEEQIDLVLEALTELQTLLIKRKEEKIKSIVGKTNSSLV